MSASLPCGRTEAWLLLLALASLSPAVLCGCSKQSSSRDGDQKPEIVAVPSRGGAITVVATGDLLLGNASASKLAEKGFDWPFVHVQPLLDGADLVIGNVAAPITTVKKRLADEKDYAYQVNPAAGPALKRAGFHALCLANDHVLDFGVPGLQETIAVLRTNQLIPFGAGDNEREARRGVVYDFGTLRIGLLGYGQKGSETKSIAKEKRAGYSGLSKNKLAQDIPRMREHADMVVVSLHWGKNYKDVTESQHELGRKAIDLGADIVFGHHPHVAQGIEVYRGKPILYSLGNFVFGSRGRFEKDKQAYGLVARWVFEGKALKWVLATPIAVNNELVKFQPRRVNADEAKQALEPHLKQYNTAVRWEGDTAFIGFAADWQTAALPRISWTNTATQPAAIPSPSAAARVPPPQ